MFLRFPANDVQMLSIVHAGSMNILVDLHSFVCVELKMFSCRSKKAP